MLKKGVAVLLMLAGVSCASPGSINDAASHAELSVDENASGSTLHLRAGQRLVVSLRGNPTTGFTWETLPWSEAVLRPQGEPRYTRSSDLVGAGGIFRFTFVGQQPGTVTLKMMYRRPFEAEKAPAANFELKVVVSRED